MKYFDHNPNIVEWASEELFVPYKNPIDGKMHRYFPDFVIKARQTGGKLQTIMIEVKPYKQTLSPTIQKRKTKRYLNEVKTFAINTYKWEAAQSFCDDRMWKFQILTEKELKI